MNEAALAQKENDDLLLGIACPVLTFDDHIAHIEKHKDLLRNPEVRRNGTQVEIILEHIAEHENHLQQIQAPPQIENQQQSNGGSNIALPPLKQ